MFRYVFTHLLLNVQISQCRKATGAAGVVFFWLFVCLVGWLVVGCSLLGKPQQALRLTYMVPKIFRAKERKRDTWRAKIRRYIVP